MPITPAPRDTSARAQRRAASPGTSAWVAASAGTGKTKVLVDRVLNLLVAGAKPQRLLCLTFTKAAAMEMALRLTETLRDWAVDEAKLEQGLRELFGETGIGDDARKRARHLFADVLDAPGGLRIQTIHAFCQSLLRRFPLEAQLPPNFQLLDDRTAIELRRESLNAVLHDARDAPDGATAAALREITARTGEEGFTEVLTRLIGERSRLQRLFDERARARSIDGLYRRLDLKPGVTEAEILAAACRDESFDLVGLRRCATALLAGSVTDKKSGARLAAFLADQATRAAGFDDYIAIYFTENGAGPRRKTLITKEGLKGAPGADAILAAEAERLAKAIRDRKSARNIAGAAALLRVGVEVEGRYRAAKNRRSVLDYEDLILETRSLLRDKPGVTPWVLFKLDGGIDHILIDEAQDTNPEQWEVIEALAAEFFAGEGAARTDRTLFAVGDVKQSIYSFQRADPISFIRMRDRFGGKAEKAGHTWNVEDLIVSFRSTAAVLQAVDAIFARAEAAAGVDFEERPIRHEIERIGHGGLVELWPVIAPQEVSEIEPWAPLVERLEEDSPPARLARLIARRIAGWVGKETLESRGRPIRASDILILVQRRNVLIDLLVRELKQAGVDVAGVDRMVLADQLAVMDLIALGRFLLLPDDDLTLATVLKGPLYEFSEEQLFELAHHRGARGLWEELRRRAGDDPVFGAAATSLSELLARVDFVRPYDLFADVLGPRGGRRRIVRRLGVEANDPLDQFLAVALSFERSHAPALETFLHWVEIGREEVKRDPEGQARDEVRVMTVHGAKGLQAPIVILPDTIRTPQNRIDLLWSDPTGDEPELPLWPGAAAHDDLISAEARQMWLMAHDAEYRRLLYVALTRAQDRLYIAGYRGGRAASDSSWYRLIEDGLKPVAEPFDFVADEISGPALRLTTPQRLKVAAPAAPRAASSVALPEWWNTPAPDEPEPPRPLAPSRPDGEDPPVRAPFDSGADDTRRFQRGRLVHRLLETLPDLPIASREAAARKFLSRAAHRLGVEQQEEIAAETLAVLNAPGWADIFGPGSGAEISIVGRAGARLVSGQIDRLLVTDTDVLAIDYKTNRPPPARAAETPAIYLRQMAAYRSLLVALYPGRRVACALLWTDGPRLMPLPESLLDPITL